MLKVVGLGGSLAARSRSRSALEVALAGASSAGAEVQLLDLRELALRMFNPDDREPTNAATELIDRCQEADGMLWSSPLYQGTIAGAFMKVAEALTCSASLTCTVMRSEVTARTWCERLLRQGERGRGGEW